MNGNTRLMAITWVALIAALFLLPLGMGSYYLYILQRVMILAILALGLNIFMGLCGQVNFGVSGFFALGAYVVAILEVKLGLHPFIGLLPAVVVGGLVAYSLSKVLLRLQHLSLALGTVAFAITVWVLLETTVPASWGGGERGLSLPITSILGHRLTYASNYYYIGIWFMIALVSCVLLRSSRVGRAWRAIREDEIAASALGVDVIKYKTSAFVVSGVLASLAGVLLSQQLRWFVASHFDLWSNLLILLIVVIGGMGSSYGMVFGALLLVVLDEILTGVLSYPTLVYGVILFLVIRFLPRGLWYHLEDLAEASSALARRRYAARY